MATYDNHKNFAITTVATAPTPATSGTSLVVVDGTVLPTASFNAVVWPFGQQPTSANAEIVRVTLVSTNTVTITRAQESSVARTIQVGDNFGANVTVKNLTDVEAAITLLGDPVVPAHGGTGLATLTAHGVLIGEGTSNVAVTSAGTSGQLLVSGGASADPAFANAAASGASMVLLKANSGTSSSTGTNVALDTVVLPVLTALDQLLVTYSFTVGASISSNGLTLRHGTDAANIVAIVAGVNLNTGEFVSGQSILSQGQEGNTKINFYINGYSSANVTANAAAGQYSATATWVSGWTLNLNISGQTSGSTKWRWAVYKLAGQ